MLERSFLMIGVLIGIFLASIGFMFVLLYTNLLTLGYNFWDFVQFISTRVECLLFVFGWILIFISIERRKRNVLLLRCFTEFRK